MGGCDLEPTDIEPTGLREDENGLRAEGLRHDGLKADESAHRADGPIRSLVSCISREMQ